MGDYQILNKSGGEIGKSGPTASTVYLYFNEGKQSLSKVVKLSAVAFLPLEKSTGELIYLSMKTIFTNHLQFCDLAVRGLYKCFLFYFTLFFRLLFFPPFYPAVKNRTLPDYETITHQVAHRKSTMGIQTSLYQITFIFFFLLSFLPQLLLGDLGVRHYQLAVWPGKVAPSLSGSLSPSVQ